MGWVYFIKKVSPGPPRTATYLRDDGKFYGFPSNAKQYETREEAERKAFLLVSKNPEWIGRVTVVRHGYNAVHEP